MEVLGVAIGIFAAVLTFITWQNGKWMKTAISGLSEVINKQTGMINKLRR